MPEVLMSFYLRRILLRPCRSARCDSDEKSGTAKFIMMITHQSTLEVSKPIDCVPAGVIRKPGTGAYEFTTRLVILIRIRD